MPGMAGVHHGARRHIRICQETVYGQVPGGPSWTVVPLLGDGMKLKASAPLYRPDTNFGGFVDTSIKIRHRQEVVGDLTTLPWPQVAQLLLDMALARDGTAEEDFYSYTIDHYTPPDPRRYRGVVAASLRIAVSGTGDGEVQFTLGLRGQDETENDALVPGDFDYSAIDIVPFMHAQSTIRINSAVQYDLEGYTLNVENQTYEAGYRPKAGVTLGVVGAQIAGTRTITLEITKLNRSALFNTAIREAQNITFEASFVHPLGHLMQITLPNLVVESSDEDGTPSQPAKEGPRLEALADATGNAIYYGVDLAAGGTTTLEPLTTTPAATTTTEEATTTTTAP